jgi:DNA-binding FadR family transcriptional regulator
LIEDFGVSPPSLREAFRILEAEALITVRRGARGGARVHPPSPEVASRYAALVLQHRGATLGDLNQARVLLEAPLAGALATLPDRDAIADKLTALLAEAEAKVDDPEAMVEANFEFHRQVVASVGNPVVTLLLDVVEGVYEGSGRSYLQLRDRGEAERNRRKALEAHARLLDLVRAGDADGAVTLWHAHLAEVGKLITDAEADEATVLDVLHS